MQTVLNAPGNSLQEAHTRESRSLSVRHAMPVRWKRRLILCRQSGSGTLKHVISCICCGRWGQQPGARADERRRRACRYCGQACAQCTPAVRPLRGALLLSPSVFRRNPLDLAGLSGHILLPHPLLWQGPSLRSWYLQPFMEQL